MNIFDAITFDRYLTMFAAGRTMSKRFLLDFLLLNFQIYRTCFVLTMKYEVTDTSRWCHRTTEGKFRNEAIVRFLYRFQNDRVDKSHKNRNDVHTDNFRRSISGKSIRLRGGSPFERSIPMETDQDLVKPVALHSKFLLGDIVSRPKQQLNPLDHFKRMDLA